MIRADLTAQEISDLVRERDIAVHTVKELEAEIEHLRTVLNAMLHQHGKPMREEWLNEAGFEEAKNVHRQACAALASSSDGADPCL
jgi:hypothetical protein